MIRIGDQGPDQINTIVQRLRASTGVTEGSVRISSSHQPIIAWASKIENGTEDPSFQIGVGAASSAQPQIRHDVGTRLLIPSSAYSDTFTSSLVVLNMDSQPNNLTITAYDTSGNLLAPPLMTALSVGAQFRSSNILQQLGAPFGSFGPIKVESISNRLLSAVSQVRTNRGFAGLFLASKCPNRLDRRIHSGGAGLRTSWDTCNLSHQSRTQQRQLRNG